MLCPYFHHGSFKSLNTFAWELLNVIIWYILNGQTQNGSIRAIDTFKFFMFLTVYDLQCLFLVINQPIKLNPCFVLISIMASKFKSLNTLCMGVFKYHNMVYSQWKNTRQLYYKRLLQVLRVSDSLWPSILVSGD